MKWVAIAKKDKSRTSGIVSWNKEKQNGVLIQLPSCFLVLANRDPLDNKHLVKLSRIFDEK